VSDYSLSIAGDHQAAAVTFTPASEFSSQALADIYNQSRADYIVPMPMNARRMEEYMRFYDVAPDRSFVARSPDGAPLGIGMLGLRGERAWVTRLGVLPDQRKLRVGSQLMRALLDAARGAGVSRMQLEVIEGNQPAHALFVKLGFVETRRLLVLRRPPAPAPEPDPACTVETLDEIGIRACLLARRDSPSWLDETPSLLNAGDLHGWRLTCPDGRSGWIICRAAGLQLSHHVIDSPDAALTAVLLRAMHRAYPRLDTKLENLPADHPHWAAFQGMGYVESFRRIEMLMCL
jgi:ribosomal protein S18 acetylase RimI-like enzyme